MTPIDSQFIAETIALSATGMRDLAVRRRGDLSVFLLEQQLGLAEVDPEQLEGEVPELR
jgi:hypothetical protein